jgi:hypothetical protein
MATAVTPQPVMAPGAQMTQMLFGKHITYSLSAVARLGVADHMGVTPVLTETLAEKVGVHAPSLYRVMRMLASLGVFAEPETGMFALTPLGELLRTDAPGSMRYLAIQFGDPWGSRPFEHFTECIRTGQEAVTMAWGKNIFELLRELPDQAETFNRSMTNLSGMERTAILEGYDFSGIGRLADIGGGHGTFLSAIVERYDNMLGVLYDLPQVVAGAQVSARIQIESGSFFERVPAGCDAYLMKHIIHDWDDARCLRILELVAAQLPAHGKVLVCDPIVSDQPVPEMAKLLDIEMLILTAGGKERTEAEFADLFRSAGLRLNRIARTAGPVCVLEAVKA